MSQSEKRLTQEELAKKAVLLARLKTYQSTQQAISNDGAEKGNRAKVKARLTDLLIAQLEKNAQVNNGTHYFETEDINNHLKVTNNRELAFASSGRSAMKTLFIESMTLMNRGVQSGVLKHPDVQTGFQRGWNSSMWSKAAAKIGQATQALVSRLG